MFLYRGPTGVETLVVVARLWRPRNDRREPKGMRLQRGLSPEQTWRTGSAKPTSKTE